jgi:putative ABC transport system permease protein
MLNLTIKNIFYKKTRSILTIVGIVIAMQLYIVLSGIMNAYDNDMQKQVASLAGKVFVQADTGGATSMLPMQNFITEEHASKILSLDGINREESTRIIYNEISPATAPNMPPLVFAVGLDIGKENLYYGNIKEEYKLNNLNDVILGHTAAAWIKEKYNAKLNDTFTINGKELNIIGILPSINTSVDSSIIMPIETVQEIYSKVGVVNAIIITANKADEVEELAETINNIGKVKASTLKEVQKTADQMLEGQRTFFAMINNTIVFVAIFMVMIIMVMAINERKKEIGTLKAIGASYSKILYMVISESTILSVIGGLIALPISILFTWIIFFGMSSTSFDTVFLYNDPKSWPGIFIVTIIIGIVSGILPAISARKVNPLESIRYE